MNLSVLSLNQIASLSLQIAENTRLSDQDGIDGNSQLSGYIGGLDVIEDNSSECRIMSTMPVPWEGGME